MSLNETRVTAVFSTDGEAPSCSLPLAVVSVSAGFPSPAYTTRWSDIPVVK
ncbi:MAG: DUF4113 domain-containing protein [Deltaproteobacteria bacterium]|nr:DUF4113 domain-containing protein [Deltaproteobacteria bacterium]